MLFFAFNLLLITLSSTANAARTMFNASWRKFPSVFSMYGFFKDLKNSFLIASESKLIPE